MAISCSVASVVTGDLSAAGPYEAGWKDVTVVRPNSSSFSAKLFYPSTTRGDNAPYDPDDAPYPAISFGHGFLQSVEQYQSTLEHLATWGFLVIASRSAGGLSPNHQSFADDLRYSLTYLEQQNVDDSSWLLGQVNTSRFGLSGHSLGGGASLLAASADPRVRTVANMAAAETDPSAISAIASLTVSVCLITGSEDGIVPPGNHGEPMYNSAPAPKQLPLILGGFHCGFMDAEFVYCDSGSISRAEQLAVTRRLLTGWFNLYLKSDQDVWDSVWGESAMTDPAVSTSMNAGIRLTASPISFVGSRNTQLQGSLEIENEGVAGTSYTMLSSHNQWDVQFVPSVTPLLQPGMKAMVDVLIQVPASPLTLFDQPVVSSRSDLDEATRVFEKLTVSLTTAADLDHDRDVDPDDFGDFLICLTGPNLGLPSPGCGTADIDEDGDVDLSDYGLLQRCYSGRGIPADPNCAD